MALCCQRCCQLQPRLRLPGRSHGLDCTTTLGLPGVGNGAHPDSVGVLVGRWLATSTHRLKPVAEAALALPLVLPPTVLGYYLLVSMGGASPLGALYQQLTGSTLAFSFSGLLLASLIFNIPFALMPIQRAFEAIPQELFDAARTCGLSRWRTLWHIEFRWRGAEFCRV